VVTAPLRFTASQWHSAKVPPNGRRPGCRLRAKVPAVRQSMTLIALLCALLAPQSTPAQGNAHAKRLERAAALINSNQLSEAEQQLSYVLRVVPNEAMALNLLGTIRAKQGRLNEAEALFSRAIRIDNKLVGARMNLAHLYLLKDVPEKTALELREVLRLDPNNADASYRLAWLLLSQGRFDECISFIDGAKQSLPLSAPLLTVLGEAYLRKGDAGKAEESYLQVLNEQSANADALLGLASVSQVRGDANGAILYLGHAREVIGDSPDLLYKFALVALNSSLHNEVVSALKRAIELRPDEPSYHFVLGTAWLRQPPDLQEAEQAFRQALKLQPENAQGQLYLGYVLLKQKKYPEAREWLEKSIQKHTGTPESFYYLGLIAQEQNENERAIGLFEKAIQLAPSFANAHIALGSAYLKLKNYPRAQQELETGVKLNPEDSKAHYNLAMLYARLKNQQRAQDEMRIVEQLKSAGKAQENEMDTLVPPRPR
jgi:tetratricopeptide (TPR) repeat protein